MGGCTATITIFCTRNNYNKVKQNDAANSCPQHNDPQKPAKGQNKLYINPLSNPLTFVS